MIKSWAGYHRQMGIPLIFSDEKQGYVNDKGLYHFNFFCFRLDNFDGMLAG